MHYIYHCYKSIINFKDIITFILSAVGLMIAYSGLQTWKDQLRGTTRYQLAKDILIKTYKLRDEFIYTRDPLITSAEMSNIENLKNLDPKEDLSFWAYRKRLMKLNDIKSELEISKLEADAIFGKHLTIEIKELINKVGEMNIEFNSFWEIKNYKNPSDEELAIQKKSKQILYGMQSDDEFGNKIKILINGVESKFRQYLK